MCAATKKKIRSGTAPVFLAVTNLPFWRGGTGSHERLLALFQHLAQTTNLHILYLDQISKEEMTQFKAAIPETQVHLSSKKLLYLRKARRRLRKTICRLLPGLAAIWSDHFGEDRHAFQCLVRTLHPDAVLVEFAYLGELVQGLPQDETRPNTILDTHDAMALRRESYAQAGLDVPAGLYSVAWEEERLAPFDVLLAIQAEEAQYFRTRYPEKTVLLVGQPGVLKVGEEISSTKVRLLFLGANNHHNQLALDWFLANVWPTIDHTRAELHVAGGICQHLNKPSDNAGIVRLGYVESLDELYASVDIVINPAIVGSGLKIKNIDALCHGKCLVTTPVGAQGFPTDENTPMVVCADANTMAVRLTELVESTEQRYQFAERAAVYAKEALSREAVYRELDQWVSGLRKTWKVVWQNGLLVGPEGTINSIPAGDMPDIALARETLDVWAAQQDVPQLFEEDGHHALWWFLRFELIHNVFFRALPNLRLLQTYRSNTGPLARIQLEDTPDFWWKTLFSAVYPEATVQVIGSPKQSVQKTILRRRAFRILRGLISLYRLRHYGVPDRPRLVVVQQARYWKDGKDFFWEGAIAELENTEYEIVPFVTSHLDFADDFKPVRERPKGTLFADMIYVAGMLHGSFRSPRKTPQMPDAPLILNGVDLCPLVHEVVTQRYCDIARAQRCFKAEAGNLLHRLRATALLTPDENGGEWAIKTAARSSGVPVIAVQHGVVHHNHCHYIYPNNIEATQIPLADLTCVRGSYYRDILVEQSCYSEESIQVTGSFESEGSIRSWMTRNMEADALRREILPKGCTRLLLFSSQDLLCTLLSGRLLDTFTASSVENYLVIRPHPREINTRYWEDEIASMGLSDRVEIRRDGNLSLWLEACDIHLSGASTVLEEAVLFGRPNIVIGADLLGDWLGVIESKTGIALEKAGSLNAAITWWEERPIAEINACRDEYLERRSHPNAVLNFVQAVKGMVDEVPSKSN